MWLTKKVSKSGGIIVNLLFYLSTKTLRTLIYFFPVYSQFFIEFGPLLRELALFVLKMCRGECLEVQLKLFPCTCSSNGILIFHGGYYMAMRRYEIYLRVLKIFHSFAALTREIFLQHEKRNFVSPSGHVMFYL